MAGSVSVTAAIPAELVVAITLLPVVVPFESVPAEAENKILAPVLFNPDWPGSSITVRDCASAEPALPV